jgi:hypothetical protein
MWCFRTRISRENVGRCECVIRSIIIHCDDDWFHTFTLLIRSHSSIEISHRILPTKINWTRETVHHFFCVIHHTLSLSSSLIAHVPDETLKKREKKRKRVCVCTKRERWREERVYVIFLVRFSLSLFFVCDFFYK